MDTSEVYAKMSREAWGDDDSYVPQVGDYAIRYMETSNRVGLVSMNRDQGVEHLYWHTLDEEDGLTLREPQTILSRLIPLYRQDQLQEMVAKGGNLSVWNVEEWFHNWIPRGARPDSFEQLWLAFVKKELYRENWDGEGWVSE